jgi:hypothetical protein
VDNEAIASVIFFFYNEVSIWLCNDEIEYC